MASIGDSGGVTPRQKRMYEAEYKHGADLFQRALEQEASSTNPYQQEQFDEVMNKALEVLNEAAQGLKRKDLMSQNQQIEKDYQAYRKSHGKEEQERLAGDLDRAKRSIY